jgi:uncharacterized protein (TIGR03437 family)
MTAVGKPHIVAAGVVNSAAFRTGIAPRALVTIFGASLSGGVTAQAPSLPLSTRLGGVQVLVNGQAASLVYVSDRQINFVAPSSLSGSTAEVTVRWGSESITSTVPLSASDPGLFMIDGDRTGAVLIANTGQTTLTRPAAAGEILEVYATGLGQARTATATVGAREAEVLFAGPNSVFPGLDQLNVRVPTGLAAGSQPLVIRVGSAASNEVFVRLR